MSGVFAVDVGGSKIRACTVDLGGRPHDIVDEPISDTRDPEPVVAQIAALIDKVSGGTPIRGVVTTPGAVDPDTGVITHAVNVPISRVPLARELQAATGSDIRVVVDTTAGAIAEFGPDGAAPGARNGVYLTVSTGIGMTMVLDGNIYPGSTHQAGEIGHLPVTADPDAPLCACGRRGCLEVYASGGGISTLLPIAGPGTTGRDVLQAARRGEPKARAAVDRAVELLAIAVTGVVQVLDPAVLVLGGGMLLGGGMFGPVVDQVLKLTAAGGSAIADRLLRPRHVEHSPLAGAAALAAKTSAAYRMIGWT